MPDSLLLIIAMLVLSGFFSGMEIAFLTANKLRIALKNQQGSVSGKILARFNENPANFIGAILIGNNIAMVIYGTQMGRFLELTLVKYFPYLKDNEIQLLLGQTLLSTLVVLIFGEFLPKSIFRLLSDKMIYALALPMQLAYSLLYPLVFFTTKTAKVFLKIVFKIELNETKLAFEKNDLAMYIQESDQTQKEIEEVHIDVQVFQKALEFNEVRVRDCMVHRTNIVALDAEETVEDLRKKFIETEHSKIFIYENNIDNIIGFVHFMDLINQKNNIKSMLHEPLIVAESMQAHDLLKAFSKQGKSLAVVVDEFGGTSGIVSIEDLVEEIFGEIEDEHDKHELVEEQIAPDSFVFSAKQEIDYLNDKYHIQLPTGDYTTLGGLIVSVHESIPAAGEVIIIQQFEFKIVEASANKIEKVQLFISNQNN